MEGDTSKMRRFWRVVTLGSYSEREFIKERTSHKYKCEQGSPTDLKHKINPLIIQTEPPDGIKSGITAAGVAEAALLNNNNPRINAIFCSL